MLRAKTSSRLAFFSFAVLCLAPPTPALAIHPHKREAREEIVRLEGLWRNAQIANDVSAMDKLLSDDYLGITPQGDVVTKAQQLDRMRSHDLTITALDASDIKIKLVGKIAIVTSLARVQGNNEASALNGEYRYTRIYEHLPSGPWKITNFEITRVRKQHGHDGSADPPMPD